MKLYKSPDNEVYAYELDGSQDHLISQDFVAITEDEANALRKQKSDKLYAEWLASQPTKEERIAKLQEQIDALKA
jgi:hypothetical protein